MVPDTQSLGKRLLQSAQHGGDGVRRQPAKPLEESVRIDGPELIERDKTRSVLKPARNSPRICLTSGRHRRDDCGPKVLVELLRGHDDTRSRLANLAAARRIEVHQMDLASVDRQTHYHVHSS